MYILYTKLLRYAVKLLIQTLENNGGRPKWQDLTAIRTVDGALVRVTTGRTDGNNLCSIPFPEQDSSTCRPTTWAFYRDRAGVPQTELSESVSQRNMNRRNIWRPKKVRQQFHNDAEHEGRLFCAIVPPIWQRHHPQQLPWGEILAYHWSGTWPAHARCVLSCTDGRKTLASTTTHRVIRQSNREQAGDCRQGVALHFISKLPSENPSTCTSLSKPNLETTVPLQTVALCVTSAVAFLTYSLSISPLKPSSVTWATHLACDCRMWQRVLC